MPHLLLLMLVSTPPAIAILLLMLLCVVCKVRRALLLLLLHKIRWALTVVLVERYNHTVCASRTIPVVPALRLSALVLLLQRRRRRRLSSASVRCIPYLVCSPTTTGLMRSVLVIWPRPLSACVLLLLTKF